MRALALPLFLTAALLLLLWAFFHDSPPEPGSEVPTASSVVAPPAELLAPAASREEGVPPPESRSVVRLLEVEDFRGYHVRGRVVCGDGRVPGGARVRVWEWEDPQFHVEDYEPFRFESEPLGDGRFELLVDRQGEFRVLASAPGECSSDVLELKLNPRFPAAEVELVLPEARRIRGVVLDHEGNPVQGLTLVAFVDVERFGGTLPEGSTSVELWGRPKTVSGRKGTFELSPVDPRAPGYVVQCWGLRQALGPFRPDDGESFQIVRIRADERALYGELPRVLPGSEGIVITVDKRLETTAQAELQLSVEGGAAPPPGSTYELRHVGPHGSVFFQWSDGGETDAEGFSTILDLLPGARYEVRICDEDQSEERFSESFVAHAGSQEVHLVMPVGWRSRLRLK